MYLREPGEGMPSWDTICLKVGFPGEVPNPTPGPHSKFRGSTLGSGDPLTRHTSLFRMQTHRPVSLWEKGTSHHLRVGIPLISYCLKLLLNPSMDWFLFLVGRALNILKSWAQSVLTPCKLTLLCRRDQSEMAAKASQHQEWSLVHEKWSAPKNVPLF